MALVYLDQNMMIGLLRCYEGKSPEYPKLADVCTKVIETSDSGKHKFLFSVNHLIESQKRGDKKSRKALIKFILGITKFNAIKPWSYIHELEIKNAVLISLGNASTDIKDRIVGDWLDVAFGSKGQFIDKTTEKPVSKEFESILKFKINDVELNAEFLSSEKFKKNSDNIKIRDKELSEHLEKKRAEMKSKHTTEKIRDIEAARMFIDFIKDPFIKITSQLVPDIKKYASEHIFKDRTTVIAFFKNIPSLYVFNELNTVRNTNFSRKIKDNDIYDLAALSVAIPYCDVVATERSWTNISKDKKLDKIYNTRLTYKLEELNEFL